MHILMFTSAFPPQVGGIQAHVLNLCRTLIKQGHEVKVVTSRQKSKKALRDHLDDIDVVRIPCVHLPKTMTLQYLAISIGAILWLHRRWQADLLHYHTFWPDVFTAFVLRRFTPTVYTVHESRFLSMSEHKKLHGRLRMALRPFNGIIAPSTELLQVAREFGVSRRSSAYIPNAVDSNEFSPNVSNGVIRQQYGISQDTVVLLCPRRLVPKNGVSFFLKGLPYILRESNSICALIVGDGAERSYLEDLVRQMHLEGHVIFTGNISNDQMPFVYADSDIVILPSLKEATSIAGLEAMASGRPVIATAVGGLPEIVDDGVTGLLVPSRDPRALASAVLCMIQCPELVSSMGQAARRRVAQEFSWERVAQETVKVYELAMASWHNRTLYRR
jgi:glycosyltransferase involved in cell wall biosynthesis